MKVSLHLCLQPSAAGFFYCVEDEKAFKALNVIATKVECKTPQKLSAEYCKNKEEDANVPSLLAMAYLGDVPLNDKVYQNTRKFVWSEDNPYFFKGSEGEGIGGPHVGYDMAWPMSIMMKAFTSQDDEEIKECIEMLMKTDAGTGFMHESFNVNDPDDFTRPWFAWQNTLFGELIIKLIDDGKLELLNSIK